MNFYSKHIFPKFLNWTMKGKDFEQYRQSVVSEASGAVLEIGFGSGLNLPYYKNIHTLSALDPSKELYNLAQEKIESASFPVTYFQASAEQMPFADNSFDSVVSTWSLCSIPHPQIALREIIRVLKPGGIFTFMEHGRSARPFISRLQNLLTPLSKCLTEGCHLNRDIEKLIRDAGFEIRTLEKFEQKSKPLAFMYKGVAVAKK